MQEDVMRSQNSKVWIEVEQLYLDHSTKRIMHDHFKAFEKEVIIYFI